MSLYVDIKYINYISPYLERFCRKSEYLWNFRCPICGDSEKNKRKARGYIYKRKNELFYRCHNCSFGSTLKKFFSLVNKQIYSEYIVEKYKEKNSSNSPKNITKKKTKETKTNKIIVFDGSLEKLSNLDSEHSAIKYIIERKIPKKYLSTLYFTEDFPTWANKFTKGKYNIEKYKTLCLTDPRIIIPFLNSNKELIAIQGRSILPLSKLRYVTIKLVEDYPKLFGLDRWNKNELTFIVEGPLDSLFLSNCLAMAGSCVDVSRIVKNKEKTIFVFDCENRNKEIIYRMKKVVEEGYRICVWPDNIVEKDINDMILSGMSCKKIERIILNNNYSGLEAILKIDQWKKC